MNELELISRLTENLPTNESVIVGPGDDCAVLQGPEPGRHVLLKTDAVVQGVHFLSDTPAEKVGHKALGRCLSDVAAMAGKPSAAVITLGLAGPDSADWAQRVYRGICDLSARYQVAVVGGETTSSQTPFISIALTGEVASDRCIRRSGAVPGDALFVTGTLGGSREGKHLDFEPRIREAQWLATLYTIHAMIDLSDGLASDCLHICRAGGVGAELFGESIPVSRPARLAARKGDSAKPGLLAALTDGEDFELLFALPASEAVALLDDWKKQFPDTSLRCIGKVTEEPGLRLREKGRIQTLKAHGYVHLQ